MSILRPNFSGRLILGNGQVFEEREGPFVKPDRDLLFKRVRIRLVSQGLQILGGYGYCDDFPQELLYRDARIHPIHEGTTGIHSLALLGRKIVMKGGKAAQLYLEEVEQTIARPGKSPPWPLTLHSCRKPWKN